MENELWDIIHFAEESFYEHYRVAMQRTPEVVKEFRMHLQRYGAEEMKTAINIACAAYHDPRTALRTIGGILHNRNNKFEDVFR